MNCDKCTYMNKLTAVICEICDNDLTVSCNNNEVIDKNNTSSSFKDSNTIELDVNISLCDRCNCEIDLNASLSCHVCGYTNRVKTTNKKAKIIKCYYCNENGHYANECNVRYSNLSSGDKNGSKYFQSSNSVDGIIELLSNTFLMENNSTFHLCSPCAHISQKGSEGYDWSCGYRNIQMLCSSLMNIETYRNKLFNGLGEIPDIHGIQSYIEKAWTEGFDTIGCQQLGGTLLGSDTWIGATECATLLRYFGLNAIVVDFNSNKNDSAANLKMRLENWFTRYFRVVCGFNNSNQNYNYFDLTNNNSSNYNNIPKDFLPPVYFQHDGHSRTVVGYEKSQANKKSKSNNFNLLIFDPSSDGKLIKSNLLNGFPQWKNQVKRGLHTMNKLQYQLVYVTNKIMTDNEREQSKFITSRLDTDSILI